MRCLHWPYVQDTNKRLQRPRYHEPQPGILCLCSRMSAACMRLLLTYLNSRNGLDKVRQPQQQVGTRHAVAHGPQCQGTRPTLDVPLQADAPLNSPPNTSYALPLATLQNTLTYHGRLRYHRRRRAARPQSPEPGRPDVPSLDLRRRQGWCREDHYVVLRGHARTSSMFVARLRASISPILPC